MEMVEVKTADLIGPALDWAVAKAIGQRVEVYPEDNPEGLWQVQKVGLLGIGPFWPHFKWEQGGPLIEKYRISLEDIGIGWIAQQPHRTAEGSMDPQDGNSPLTAACRAIVAAKLGDVVSVPAELLEK